MKIMTLNAHSHAVDFSEKVFYRNLDVLAEHMARWQVDVLALQEVCQTKAAAAADRELLAGYVPVSPEAVIRSDNFVFQLIQRLKQEGWCCDWTWCGIKTGYGLYDEGLAVVSRLPMEQVQLYDLSEVQDYENWKTRKAIGIRTGSTWFVSTHMGWWDDEEEPFRRQMDRLQKELGEMEERIFLMGDFNSPSNRRQAGYDYVCSYGWLDTCRLAGKKDNDITVPGKIDGWGEDAQAGLCIDYIWTNRPVSVSSSRTVFSGAQEPIISDHYGILIETA